MSRYPDRWVVLKITPAGESPWYRLFAGWYGNFAQGDSWRANSGITRIEDKGDHYVIHGNSGSQYICGKEVETMSAYMDSILYGWQQESIETGRANIEVVPINQVVTEL